MSRDPRTSSPLFLPYRESDVAAALAHRPEILQGVIVPLSPDASLAARAAGLRTTPAWSFVEEADAASVERSLHRAWSLWRSQARVHHDGIDLLALDALRHATALARLMWSAFIVERVIERLRPSTVVVPGPATGHALLRPTGDDAVPAMAQAARAVAHDVARRGGGEPAVTIWPESPESPAPPAPRSTTTPTPTPTLAPIDPTTARDTRLAYGHIEPPGREPSAGDLPDRLAGAILAPASGPDLDRIVPVLDRLDARGWTTAQIWKSADPDVVRRLRASGRTVCHEYDIDRDAMADSEGRPVPHAEAAARRAARDTRLRTAGASARARLRAAAAACDDALVRRTLLDVGSDHVDFVLGPYLPPMADHVDRWTQVVERARPAACVATTTNPVFDVLAHRGVPAVLGAHGLMTTGTRWRYAALPPCTVAAIGRPQADRLATSPPAGAVEVTGDAAAASLVRSIRAHARRKETSPPTPSSDVPGPTPPTEVAPTGVASPRAPVRLLLLTGNLGRPARLTDLPVIDWDAALDQLVELAAAAGARPGWTIHWRRHPRFDHDALADMLERAAGRSGVLHLASECSLADACADTDVVVAANITTSAMLEASTGARPVILLHGAMRWYDPTRWALEPWPHAASVEALVGAIESWQRDPAARAAACAAAARGAAELFDGVTDDPAGALSDLVAARAANQTANRTANHTRSRTPDHDRAVAAPHRDAARSRGTQVTGGASSTVEAAPAAERGSTRDVDRPPYVAAPSATDHC